MNSFQRVSVMLVDDEPLALENVAELIDWNEHGFVIAAKMADPRKALERFERLRPKIVITDISMPHMDGLELARQILAIDSNTRIVILTAYRDFDYARQALELKAAHYVLKHEISRNRLLIQLLAIKESIFAEQSMWRNVKKQLLLDLLHGKRTLEASESASPPAAKELFHNLQGSSALVYFQAKPRILLNGENISSPLQDPNRVWDTIASRFIHDEESSVRFEAAEDGSEGYVLLVKLPDHHSTLFCWNAAVHFVSLLEKTVFESEQANARFCMTICSKAEEIPAFYKAIRDHYDANWFLPMRAIFTLEQARLSFNGQQPAEWEDRLHNAKRALRLQDKDAAILQLYQLFTDLIVPAKQAYPFRRAVKELGSVFVEQFGLNPLLPLGEDAASIVQALLQQAEYSLRGDAKLSRWVLKATDYVKAHYGDGDLSVESIAARLNISSIHLRKTFKKETGRTLSDYITEFRIERAKELLIKDEHKIYEISALVGYQTSQYFSQVFKKMTGVYPTDYKERQGGGNEPQH